MYTFNLLTDKAEKTEYIYKKPHPLIHQFWNDRVDQLRKYIEEQKDKIKYNLPEELLHLRSNLFVAPGLSEIVETNLRESGDTLDTLSLKVEKN